MSEYIWWHIIQQKRDMEVSIELMKGKGFTLEKIFPTKVEGQTSIKYVALYFRKQKPENTLNF